MVICPVCGTHNRERARFCTACAAALRSPRPSPDDHAWLAATLTTDSAYDHQHAAPTERAPQLFEEGERMEAASASSPTMIGGRYEIVSQQDKNVEVLDREPWKRCWACGTTANEAGEQFCIDCGAELGGRPYQGQLVPADAPSGLALVEAISDERARAMLPVVWDSVRDGDALLTLAANNGHTPLAPPLGETEALQVGAGLAHLLETLHGEGYVLGPVAADALELTDGKPHLRNAPALRKLAKNEPKALAADLKSLTTLLESLTATPRTTRRLEDTPAIDSAPALPETLRAVRTGEISTAAALAERLDAMLAERAQPFPLWTQIGAASDKGMLREIDEDSLLVLDLRTVQNSNGRSWGVFIVADGMGGHSAGEVASGLALRGAAEVVLRAYLTPAMETDAPVEQQLMEDTVRQACIQANEYVLREGRARGNDMGTTITMALVAGNRAVIGNVGDSRTYIYRDGALRRISQDHSLVMRLVELGQITEEDIYTHPQRNAILRSLGDKADVQVDIFTERLRHGDALFLCCDGQWEMTHDQEMTEIIKANDDPQAACDALIAAANAAGGDDNITSVLVKFLQYSE